MQTSLRQIPANTVLGWQGLLNEQNCSEENLLQTLFREKELLLLSSSLWLWLSKLECVECIECMECMECLECMERVERVECMERVERVQRVDRVECMYRVYRVIEY